MMTTSLLLSLFIFTAEKPTNTQESLKALLAHLKVGTGATVAEIGAGRGNETIIFAEIVGPEGKVYSEEIDKGKVDQLKKKFKEKKLNQVIPVLGKSDTPNLPDRSTDLIFMKRVYHHFAKPRAMLRNMLYALKPGGLMVIVDQHKGTLRDWVPNEVREKKHHFSAETVVVRLAREEGFQFVKCAEKFWHDEKPFVLVFRRPKKPAEPKGDPDAFKPLDLKAAEKLFQPRDKAFANPVFIALDEGRKLMPQLLEKSTGKAHDIILEEWATLKDERPAIPKDLAIDSGLTEKGMPKLTPQPVDAIFFLDSYHRLFHGKTLLAQLHKTAVPGCRVYVLDRPAKRKLPRRLASHRHRINMKMVTEEMAAAGFNCITDEPQRISGRFLLVFEKKSGG